MVNCNLGFFSFFFFFFSHLCFEVPCANTRVQADGRIISLSFMSAPTRAVNNTPESYAAQRERTEMERRKRVAETGFQDGRFGFGDDNQLLYNNRERGLYSDQVMASAPTRRTTWNVTKRS